MSSETFERGVRTLLGEKAVNVEKDKVEGTFHTSQTVWGLIFETETEVATLPEKRIQKGATLVACPGFDFGAKTLTLKELQQFRGIMTGWSSVAPGLEGELKAADKFLRGQDGAAPIRPVLRGDGSPDWETEWAWQDVWELFETCRWLSARTDQWDLLFSTGFRNMLPAAERLALNQESGTGSRGRHRTPQRRLRAQWMTCDRGSRGSSPTSGCRSRTRRW